MYNALISHHHNSKIYGNHGKLQMLVMMTYQNKIKINFESVSTTKIK